MKFQRILLWAALSLFVAAMAWPTSAHSQTKRPGVRVKKPQRVLAAKDKRRLRAHFKLVQGAALVKPQDIRKKLNARQRRLLQATVETLAKGRPQSEALASWKGLIREKPSADIAALIQYVLREAYIENNNDLRLYARKVRQFNEQKKKIRSEVARARAYRASMGSKRRPGAATKFVVAELGIPNQVPPPGTKVGADELDAHLAEWEEKLQSIGDDAQLANIDLQNILQKQQQTIQMMSSMSKTMHDTAMAIIRKIGG